jgi:hypothetical protein
MAAQGPSVLPPNGPALSYRPLTNFRRLSTLAARNHHGSMRLRPVSANASTDARADEGLALHDLLTDEKRIVQEVLGSKALVKRDCILGRVVERDGTIVLGGTHPRPLPPTAATEIVRRVRGRLRRKRATPADRLRDEQAGRYLIRRWEEAVAEVDLRRSRPPGLRNTDGERFILTTDHYVIVPGRQRAREDVHPLSELLRGELLLGTPASPGVRRMTRAPLDARVMNFAADAPAGDPRDRACRRGRRGR